MTPREREPAAKMKTWFNLVAPHVEGEEQAPRCPLASTGTPCFVCSQKYIQKKR